MIINNSLPEHQLLRKIYRHVDFSFIHELVIRRMEPFPSPDNLSLLNDFPHVQSKRIYTFVIGFTELAIRVINSGKSVVNSGGRTLELVIK
jgi:hypothetical protein